MHPIIQAIEKENRRQQPLEQFRVGDIVDVHVKIKEGEKERVQVFSGTVIRVRAGRGIRGSFTVRRIVAGEGVERTFPFHAPTIQSVRVKRPGKVRRAKLYYLRERVGKATKVKERRIDDRSDRKGQELEEAGLPAAGEASGSKEKVEEPVA
jgi:large subunit ribosomal protein L19